MATQQQQSRIRPLHDRIIVQRIEEGEQKVGGIIIPDTAKEKPQQGKVIAVGKGKVEKDGKVTPLDVKEGDTILFGKYSGQEIKLDGEEYLIMREEEVLGVIDERSSGRESESSRSMSSTTEITDNMAKQIIYGEESRQAILRGVNAPRRRGQGHARPQGPQRRPRQEVRLAHDHQGRRHRRQGNRPQGPAREHGRADGARSREQDVRHRR